MRKILSFIILFLCFSICYSETSYDAYIIDAEKNFSEGNFARTIEIYESMIKIGNIQNSNLYYNLANAYYRNGEIGKAVLNINKAHILSPRDKDIKSNLDFISRAAGVKSEYKLPVSLNEITVFTASAFIIMLLSFSLFFINRKKLFKKTGLFFLYFTILLLIIFGLKFYDEIIEIKAIALNDIIIRSGPNASNTELFKVREGDKIIVLSENNVWSNIKIKSEETELEGWVESKDIALINN